MRPRIASLSFLPAIVLLLALGTAGAACAQGGGGQLATVDGKPITQADVEASASEQFKQLEQQYKQNRRDLLENKLEELIQERLVEAEAKARGITKEALLAGIKPAAVTDADIEKFYEENKARIPPTTAKETVMPQIRQYLEQQSVQKGRQAFYDELRQKHAVRMLIEPVRVQVAATGPAKGGPESAPVTVVEFSDFQCPYCARLVPTIEQAMAKYGDKVRLVFRQFPLNFHQFAQKAAEASLCANDQGKFWELHDAMFANQQGLAVEQLKARAVELGMNAETFNQCLDSGKHAAAVAADLKAGSEAGVSGTPATFINGRFLNGAVPLEEITKVIDDELARKSGKG